MTKTEREIIRAAKAWGQWEWSPTVAQGKVCRCEACNLKRAVLADEKAKKKRAREVGA